jgi:hypothetical protein
VMVGEFFAARADDIDRQLVANGPYGRFSTVEANGLTEVTIATLGESSEQEATTASLSVRPKGQRPKGQRPTRARRGS